MDILSTVLASVIVIMFLLFMIHQEVLFGRMIRQNEKVMQASNERQAHLLEQNNVLLEHADMRLDRANEMVLTLAHSADKLSVSISELKDLMITQEKDYVTKNDEIAKNRDEFKSAYHALLEQFKDQQSRLRSIADEDHRKLTELAARPIVSNTNNNNLNDDAELN